MRVLIFGDVHGNLVALEKMLQQVSSDVDLLVCHGDVVNYGPWSNECVQLLQDINCTCLTGNHESYFLEGSYAGENKVAKTFFNHCYPIFHQKELISNYSESKLIGDFQVQHTINNQYIYPDTDFNKLQLKKNYIIGHSHHQFSALTALGKRLINTGSVGQNRKFINVINYIIYDVSKADIQLETLVYDIDLVIKEMRKSGYPQICLDYYLQKERL